jgi:hypothetical protein
MNPKLFSWTSIKTDVPIQLQKLSIFLTRCRTAMFDQSFSALLNHPDTLRSGVQKLPTYLRNKWAEKAYDMQQNRSVTFADLEAFVKRASEVANNPMFGKCTLSVSAGASGVVQQSKPLRNCAASTNDLVDRPCFVCGERGHRVTSCKALTSLESIEAKRELLKAKGMCFACLGRGHRARDCKRHHKCGVCKRSHPTVMHVESPGTDKPDSEASSAIATKGQEARIFHPILPVIVQQKGSNKSTITYCLLDNGSSGSFISRALYDELNLSSREGLLQLNTIQGASYEKSTIVEGLVVSDCDGQNPFQVPKVFVKDMIPMDEDSVATAELCLEIPELKQFASLMPPHFPNAGVGMLLGCNSALLEPIKIEPSGSNSVFAVKYAHGWAIQGSVGLPSNVLSCHRIVAREGYKEALIVREPTPCQIVNMLESDFVERRLHPDEYESSPEDRLFSKVVSEAIAFENGHHTVCRTHHGVYHHRKRKFQSGDAD